MGPILTVAIKYIITVTKHTHGKLFPVCAS